MAGGKQPSSYPNFDSLPLQYPGSGDNIFFAKVTKGSFQI